MLSLDFISFALSEQVLKFGEFTLKSGRSSPYFFNAGLFNTSQSIQRLGEFYAQLIMGQQIEFDVLFGPAYKGIPIATSTACALATHNINVGVSFDRKEAKSHGEKGKIIGTELQGKRVLVLDDVITAGTAFGQAKTLIESEGGHLVGLVIALDRQETTIEGTSAIGHIRDAYNLPVTAIATLEDIKSHLSSQGLNEELRTMESYQEKYGTKNVSS